MKISKPLIIGHRGAMALAPENTLSSFQKAIELGVDMIELDVHLSKDNQAIVIHDKSVDRTTDGKGVIKELTLEEIKRLNIDENEKVPTLQEVIDFVNGRCKINIEVKDEKALEETIKIVKKNKIEDEVIISSFIQDVLKESKKIDPEIRTAMLFVTADIEHLELAQELGVYSLHVNFNLINKEYLEKTHKFGLRVHAWESAEDKSDFQKAIELGVDGIITNDPGLIK